MADSDRPRRPLKPGFQARHRNARLVSKYQLWQIFAAARIMERFQKGELREVILYNKPASSRMGQEPGTLSQRIGYVDGDNKRVAEVHQYLKTDGTLGGSGQPDPKEVLHEGILYYCGP